MITVLLVDDHEMVRLGVKSYLQLQEDIDVIAEASDGLEGYEKALQLQPDIILMDVVMENMNGIDATKQILKDWKCEHKPAKIIMVTSFIDDEKLYPAIKAGACGYLLKTSSAESIAQAIRLAYNGEKVFEKQVSDKLKDNQYPTHPLHEDLTLREKEILLLIAQGYSNQEIAEMLFITLKTVKTHVSNILSKLEVEDRTQATIYAFKKGLMS